MAWGCDLTWVFKLAMRKKDSIIDMYVCKFGLGNLIHQTVFSPIGLIELGVFL